MPEGKSLRIGFAVALFLLLGVTPIGIRAADSSDLWLPITKLEFTNDGRLVGWQVDGLDAGPANILDTAEDQLAVLLSYANRDLSDEVAWRRAVPRSGYLSEFVGTIWDPAIEIRRSYKLGDTSGTFIHNLRISSDATAPLEDIELVLEAQPNLRFHRLNDRSLGDVFYSFHRVFGSDATSQSFQLISRQQVVTSFASVARHVAVIVSPTRGDDGQLTVLPEAKVILKAQITKFPFELTQTFAAKKLAGNMQSDSAYGDFLYSDMIAPMRVLAKAIEWSLQRLTSVFNNAGLALVIFTLLVRVLMFPLNQWSTRQQFQFSEVQKRMKPKVEIINNTLKGAEKSERMLDLYKEFGISPFSGLKGSLALFLQLPILIAVFAITTESAIFRGVSLLWATDISLPDRAAELPFSIVGLGGYLNMLPVVLGLVSVSAAYVQSRLAGGRRIPLAGLLLALAFVAFFYSCAAALVLYWIIVNFMQILESVLARLREKPFAHT